jgi:hypothetical protein
MNQNSTASSFRRILLIWIVLGLAALFAVRPQEANPPYSVQILATIIWGSVVGLGTRFAFFLRHARTSRGPLPPSGSTYRLWKLLPAAVCVGGIASCFSLPIQWLATHFSLSYASHLPLVSILVTSAIYFFLPAHKFKNLTPRHTSFGAWIVLDTALPVGLVSSVLGVGIAQVRFWGIQIVDGAAAAQHLALTCIVYGLCLGTVGFMKAFSEQQGGLIQFKSTEISSPSPFVTGLVMAVAVVWILPHAIDSITLMQLSVIKATMGLTIGGLLCAFGAVRGAKANHPSQDQHPTLSA